jgi:hypothetical protein
MPPALCEASPGTLKAYLARSFITLAEAKISERYQVLKNPSGRAMNADDHEPDIDPSYRTLENVFLTPHIGSATENTRNAMGLMLLEGLHAFETGQVARNRVCSHPLL